MSQYFPKRFRSFGRNMNVDLSNYATKTDLKNISHVDASSFALKTNLASLKTEVDKLDIDKLVPVPADLSKLSAVVKNNVAKRVLLNPPTHRPTVHRLLTHQPTDPIIIFKRLENSKTFKL